MGHFGGRHNFHKSHHRSHIHHSHFSHSSGFGSSSRNTHSAFTSHSSHSTTGSWGGGSNFSSGTGSAFSGEGCCCDDSKGTEEWKTGVCGCCSSGDCGGFMQSIFCYYCSLGYVFDALEDEPDGSPYNQACVITFLFDFCVYGTGTPILHTGLRSRITEKFNIAETGMNSCFAACYCPCCSVAQMRRELIAHQKTISGVCAPPGQLTIGVVPQEMGAEKNSNNTTAAMTEPTTENANINNSNNNVVVGTVDTTSWHAPATTASTTAAAPPPPPPVLPYFAQSNVAAPLGSMEPTATTTASTTHQQGQQQQRPNDYFAPPPTTDAHYFASSSAPRAFGTPTNP